MLKTCAALVALFACGGGDAPLEIKNARATYGFLGAARSAGPRYPGETIHFSFDVANMKFDENSRASYSTTVEIFDSAKHQLFRLGPTNAVAQNFLGGNSLPCSAQFDIPLDAAPGEYTMRVTVKDRATNKTATLERKAKLSAHEFALVNAALFADRETRVPAAPIGVIGESLYVHFSALDFGRDKTTGQPDLAVTMRVLDDKGAPTFAKPLSGHVNKDVPESVKIMPLQFALTLNRAGNFTIELEATCKVCNKKTKTTLPLKVISLGN